MKDVENLPPQESFAKLIAKEVKKVLGNQKNKNHGAPKNPTTARLTSKPNGKEKGKENSRKNQKRLSQSQTQTSQKTGRATRAGNQNKNRNTPPPSSSKGNPNARRFGSEKATKPRNFRRGPPRNYRDGPLQSRNRPQNQSGTGHR